jgi:nucleotide-binding universal stress UspA family protein
MEAKVTNTILDPSSNGQAEPSTLPRSAALLLATDGTAQSDAAIELAYLLSLKDQSDVTVLTVVDRAPVPWGSVDVSVVLDYERGQLREAQQRVRAQVERLGNNKWTIEVRNGNPTTTIADLAKETGARLLVVGLGGHGPAARFFGNETALRLMRVSRTPVLAVDRTLQALPSRIVVAMDFSESSIKAARLALDIAAPGATLTLVHVVPWERKEYVPEQWFRDHESYIDSQLKRVTGWLNHHDRCRIHQRILYGKPGPSILACADDLDANLIVAGTHGRNLLGRIFGGETVAKLVRGARRSVLVFPHAAAFEGLDSTAHEAHTPEAVPVWSE